MLIEEVKLKLSELKIVPVVTISDADRAKTVGRILQECDLPVIEITYRAEGAEKAVFAFKEAYPDFLVGVGSISNKENLRSAVNAGADFLVSPGFNIETVKLAAENNIPLIPGINNPTAIEMAINAQVDVVKFFPAEASGGVKMLKSLLAPYQHLSVMPTGGINLNNIPDYLAINNVFACGGSWLIDEKALQNKDWRFIADKCHQAVDEIEKIKSL